MVASELYGTLPVCRRRASVLIVDDDPANLRALGQLLQAHYEVLVAPSGKRALAIAAGHPKPDLILLDIMMPDMDGYKVLDCLYEQPAMRDIPVIFVTGMDSSQDEEKGLERGAVDYISKPYSPAIVLARVHTQLEVKQARDWLRDQNSYLETEVARRMEDILAIQDITINSLAELAETRDADTGNHIRRTQEYVRILAEQLAGHPRFSAFLNAHVIQLLVKSAPLHDIGKVGIPDHILLKPGKLSSEEWTIMKTHSQLGAMAIERAVRTANRRVDFLEMAWQIALFHHEKWDGSGHPEGRKGDDIPIPARLMALADVFDALVSPRVYKSPMPVERARDVIALASGQHFDPDVVAAFLARFSDFVGVAQRYQERERALDCAAGRPETHCPEER